MLQKTCATIGGQIEPGTESMTTISVPLDSGDAGAAYLFW